MCFVVGSKLVITRHVQVPKVLKVVKELPRNNMGKVNKRDLTLTVFGEKL